MAADPADMMQPSTEGATTSKMLIGLAAGLAGALPLLLAGLLPWLRAPGAPPLAVLAGLLALSWWGGMGMRLTNIEDAYDLAVTVFLPWQMLLAFFLSQLLEGLPAEGGGARAMKVRVHVTLKNGVLDPAGQGDPPRARRARLRRRQRRARGQVDRARPRRRRQSTSEIEEMCRSCSPTP